MPDDGAHQITRPVGEAIGDQAARHDRPALTAFIADARSEEALRDGLSDFVSEGIDIRRGGVRSAIAAMVANPQDLIHGRGVNKSDPKVANTAIQHIWTDTPKSLLDATGQSSGGGGGGAGGSGGGAGAGAGGAAPAGG